MKNLLLIATIVITATLNNASANTSACNLTLLKKKVDAKTSYTIKGDRLSKKNITKLSRVCSINYELMTASQVKALKITQLQEKLAKLQAK